ncbi:hypothetical protein P9429_11665 [Bacillus atrophaeus]|uniref:hypothetical protein n=1 Tax=Bacillus atrophaeus TaxID=1452 RepID=UPI002E1B3010|nr:hypothetical protein [Bacillus atrophaeus]
MGYREALESAGAEVLLYEEFGSYQGDWLAKVRYEGQIGWVHDYFGSCSGCDAFEAEFGWEDPSEEDLADFGKRYLSYMYTQDEIEARASENLDWDLTAEIMVNFVKENSIHKDVIN